jgi:hypothetical protein
MHDLKLLKQGSEGFVGVPQSLFPYSGYREAESAYVFDGNSLKPVFKRYTRYRYFKVPVLFLIAIYPSKVDKAEVATRDLQWWIRRHGINGCGLFQNIVSYFGRLERLWEGYGSSAMGIYAQEPS